MVTLTTLSFTPLGLEALVPFPPNLVLPGLGMGFKTAPAMTGALGVVPRGAQYPSDRSARRAASGWQFFRHRGCGHGGPDEPGDALRSAGRKGSPAITRRFSNLWRGLQDPCWNRRPVRGLSL